MLFSNPFDGIGRHGKFKIYFFLSTGSNPVKGNTKLIIGFLKVIYFIKNDLGKVRIGIKIKCMFNIL